MPSHYNKTRDKQGGRKTKPTLRLEDIPGEGMAQAAGNAIRRTRRQQMKRLGL